MSTVRPNNPYRDAQGSTAAQLWELDAEVTHLRRMVVTRSLKAAGRFSAWLHRSWREWLVG